MTVVEGVTFSGTPSQVVNLPAYLRGIAGATIVFVAYVYAATRWPVPWYAPLIAAWLLIAASVVLAYLRTATTEIIIDTARVLVQIVPANGLELSEQNEPTSRDEQAEESGEVVRRTPF
ncbi:hypothetical protein V4C53_47360 [Paraburkholderia azotifigens]|uniref:hypothetical protein n=1 Tax=Paraburkholderia azotifigens TaxID=2057004 RepID=UPI0031809829